MDAKVIFKDFMLFYNEICNHFLVIKCKYSTFSYFVVIHQLGSRNQLSLQLRIPIYYVLNLLVMKLLVSDIHLALFSIIYGP